MSRFMDSYTRAVDAHRQAVAHLGAARELLARPATPPGGPQVEQPIVGRLQQVAAGLGRGWLAAPPGHDAPFGTVSLHEPAPVRVGEAQLSAAGTFPALVRLGPGAHLAVDADARDPRVAALLRGLVFRLVASAPAGTLRITLVDQLGLGAVFAPLRPLVDAGVLAAPATSADEAVEIVAAAERHAKAAAARPTATDDEVLLLCFSRVPEPAVLERLAALTHAGAASRVCLLLAGHPQPSFGRPAPPLGGATQLSIQDGWAWLIGPDGERLVAPIDLDGEPPAAAVGVLAETLGERVRRDAHLTFEALLPERVWQESSADGLRTVIGRAGREAYELAFDDATPHWLVGGRTGAGKTVFLLDLLYGLAARYPPDELMLYLLDFKEGVSFTEFVSTARDPSWIPHARTVGVECDREYGVAVLRDLRRELNRRAGALKRHGVTKLADLRRAQPGVPVPRVVAVIDEFQVLFAGNDSLARQAVALLEDLARKGRSFGIHLVLASQSVSGIEALYGKIDAIFGQFPMRVALPGGSGVLQTLNTAADGLPLGTAVVNPAAGLPSANTVIRFPDAHAGTDRVAALRHELWEQRPPQSPPPAVFRGFDSLAVDDDPTIRGLLPVHHPMVMVGRVVDVGLPMAGFALDTTPGRHLAVVGTTPVAADVLHAAALSLARQHTPGEARFVVASLVAVADDVAEALSTVLRDGRHPVDRVNARELVALVQQLAAQEDEAPAHRTYLVVFGMDTTSSLFAASDPVTFRPAREHLQKLLRQGPGAGVHLLAWWRGLRRLGEDLGGTHNRDDVACLVALNVPGAELGTYLGDNALAYAPRANRALLVDRHDNRQALMVPFTRPDRVFEEVG